MSDDKDIQKGSALMEEAFSFYYDQFRFYHRWAKLHRYGYWILVLFGVGLGIAIAFCLLLKIDTLYIAALALALNCLLVVSNAIGSDRKYPRYRVVEIRLAFALQSARNVVTQQVRKGHSLEDAILEVSNTLHSKVEALVLEEFIDFFRDMKSIDEIYKNISEKTNLSAKA